MNGSGRDYEKVQQSAFTQLIETGCYSGDFEHAPHAQKLFYEAMQDVLTRFAIGHPVSILDCGCGNGAWLEFIEARFGATVSMQLYGFDLTPGMVDLAAERLQASAPREHFKQGNILDVEAYQFPGVQTFDLIYTYDVVQQLPRKMQFDACRSLIQHLNPGGIAVIFDNDHHSKFGRKMAFRKFITRYFRVPMVPDYFCNAHYPPLRRFAEKIEMDTGRETAISVSENGMKRALLVFPTSD